MKKCGFIFEDIGKTKKLDSDEFIEIIPTKLEDALKIWFGMGQ